MEIVLNQPDCDCDDHLVALFDHSASGDSNNLLKNTLQEKITEFSQQFKSMDLSPIAESNKIHYRDFVSRIPQGFTAVPFHPPSV